MGDTTNRVIDVIRENRVRFEDFCRSLTDEQLERAVPDSTWSVRDYIAHLATLDPQLTRWFDTAAAGGNTDSRIGANGLPFDIDQFNDAQVRSRRQWPLEQVLAEAAQNRVALIETLERLTDEQAETMIEFAGDNKRSGGKIPLKLFLAGWAQHDPIHVADMLKALPELADDPDLRAWLDNPFVTGYQKAMSGAPRA